MKDKRKVVQSPESLSNLGEAVVWYHKSHEYEVMLIIALGTNDGDSVAISTRGPLRHFCVEEFDVDEKVKKKKP